MIARGESGNYVKVYALMLARGRAPWNFTMSYSFAYYGAETIVVATEVRSIRAPSIPTAAVRQRAIVVVAGTDQIGAIVKGIGGHLKHVYKVDNSSPIPERLAELVRRVA